MFTDLFQLLYPGHQRNLQEHGFVLAPERSISLLQYRQLVLVLPDPFCQAFEGYLCAAAQCLWWRAVV
jgi:hypothetical protein